MGACDECKAYIGPLRDEVIQIFNDLEIEEVRYYKLSTPTPPPTTFATILGGIQRMDVD